MVHPQPSGGFEWVQAPWGAVLQCGPLAAAARHFFTTGDVELRDGDPRWRDLAAYAGVTFQSLLLVRQVHGADVALAKSDRVDPWPRPVADILLTDDPAAAVAVRTADCVPILMAEETGRAVAAVHAGWRGLARRTPITAVAAMLERYGVRPERLIAAIGPAIGPCCYQVGGDVRQAFLDAGHHSALVERWFAPQTGGRFLLDMWAATREQLEGAGMQPVRIHSVDLCTLTHAGLFHSYRAAGTKAGRMAAVIRPGRG
jgi:YfiH family protein